MAAATQPTSQLWTWRGTVTVIIFLVVFGIFITPIQWYIAYRGVERENQYGRRQARKRKNGRTTSPVEKICRITSILADPSNHVAEYTL